MKIEKKNIKKGGEGIFKNKVYLEDAINELKNLLGDSRKTEKDLLSIFINRYDYQSIHPYEKNKNTPMNVNNVNKTELHKISKREFAYKKYKYYLILYCFYSTLTKKNKTKKIIDKHTSFEMELQKTFTSNRSYVADKIVFFKPELLKTSLKNLLKNQQYDEARTLCLSAFNDDKYTKGGFTAVGKKETPFILYSNRTRNFRKRIVIKFSKEKFMKLSKGQGESDKNYTINVDSYANDIKEITGTRYGSPFYKLVIETSSIGQAIRQRLNELGVKNNNKNNFATLNNLSGKRLLNKKRTNYNSNTTSLQNKVTSQLSKTNVNSTNNSTNVKTSVNGSNGNGSNGNGSNGNGSNGNGSNRNSTNRNSTNRNSTNNNLRVNSSNGEPRVNGSKGGKKTVKKPVKKTTTKKTVKKPVKKPVKKTTTKKPVKKTVKKTVKKPVKKTTTKKMVKKPVKKTTSKKK